MNIINNLKKPTIEYSGEDLGYSFFIDSMNIKAHFQKKQSEILFFEALNTMRHFK